MSKHLFLWGECPLPESAASASDYNEKKAKKFNKMMEIQVLMGKLCAFQTLMNKGPAKVLVWLSHEWPESTLVYFPGFTFLKNTNNRHLYSSFTTLYGFVHQNFIQNNNSPGIGFSGNGIWESQKWRSREEARVHERPAPVWVSG